MKCVDPLNLVASRLALKNLSNAAREESADGDRLWAASYLFNQKRAPRDHEDDGNLRRQIADAMLAEKSILIAIAYRLKIEGLNAF